jgi:hypothetical protein
MRVCTIFNGPDFYTGPLLSTFVLREAKGDLELDDLNQVPYLRITQPLLDCLDFTSFEAAFVYLQLIVNQLLFKYGF